MSTEVTNRPENAAQLADLIESLTVFDYIDGGDGYNKSAEAISQATLAAFEYVARKVGATGFQASWAALEFYGKAMHIDGPYMVVKIEDALYPQYDLPERVRTAIAEQAPWLAERAAAKLAEYAAPELAGLGPHPDVEAHWRKLAAATTPNPESEAR